jgi:APA family basic amino acid/polyamine antiporter
VAAGILTFIFITNLLGVKLAAQIQGVFVVILIAALLYYSGSGLAIIEWQHFSNIFEKGVPNLLLGTALLTFTYIGANGIIELGGEIINPGKVIPRAFFIAFPIILVVYVLVAIATVGAVPAEILIGAKEPLIAVSRLTISNSGLFFFVSGGAILALMTTLNALFIVGTKSLLIIVEDRLLPAGIGRLNGRFGTPHVLLTIVWIFSLIGIVSGFSLETLASYASLGGLIIFIPIQIAAIRLPGLYPDHYQTAEFKLKGFWLWFCPMVGILMVVFFSMIILIDLRSVWKIGWFFAFIVSGMLYYQWRKRYLFAKGFRLNDPRKSGANWSE